jgi:hypothetical protein
MSPVICAESAYPERQAASVLNNASVLKVSLFLLLVYELRTGSA